MILRSTFFCQSEIVQRSMRERRRQVNPLRPGNGNKVGTNETDHCTHSGDFLHDAVLTAKVTTSMVSWMKSAIWRFLYHRSQARCRQYQPHARAMDVNQSRRKVEKFIHKLQEELAVKLFYRNAHSHSAPGRMMNYQLSEQSEIKQSRRTCPRKNYQVIPYKYAKQSWRICPLNKYRFSA